MRDAVMGGSTVEACGVDSRALVARSMVWREHAYVARRLPVRVCLCVMGGLSLGLWWMLWLAVQAVF